MDYHLFRLEKENAIISINHRGKKLFFDSSWGGRKKEIMQLVGYLRKPVSRAILVYLSTIDDVSLQEVAEKMQMTNPALHWHIRRFIEDEVVIAKKRGRSVVLSLLIDPRIILNLGKEVYPSAWDKFLDEIHSKFVR